VDTDAHRASLRVVGVSQSAPPGAVVQAGPGARPGPADQPGSGRWSITRKGDRYAAPSGPPVQVVHKGCGQAAEAVLVCSSCGEPLGPRDVTASPGPGRSHSSALFPRRARQEA